MAEIQLAVELKEMKRNYSGDDRNEIELRKQKRRESNARYYRENRDASLALDEHIGESCETEVLDTEGVISEEELIQIEQEGKFALVGNEKKKYIYENAREKLLAKSAARIVCAICDCSRPRSKMHRSRPRGRQAELWYTRLSPLNDFPSSLRAFYDISKWIPEFKGALLSKKGVEFLAEVHPTGYVQICNGCKRSMSIASEKPPKFSIANGFDIGCLPLELQDSTYIERRMTSITSICTPITVLSGGKHTFIKGHVSVFAMDPGIIATRLPQLLSAEDEKFLVVIAGRLTPAQEISAMRRHLCRTDAVRDLLKFYVSNNIIYRKAGVILDEEVMAKMALEEESCAIRVLRDPSASGSPDESERERRSPQSEAVELQYKEISSVLVESVPHTTVEALGAAKQAILVRCSGHFVSDYDKDILGMAFLDLFPFGRGHPGTLRPVVVSFEECCRHYMRLSRRTFAQHKTFGLVVFDICGRRRVVTSTTIRARCNPEQYERIGIVSRDELATALSEQRKRRENSLAGRGNLADNRSKGTTAKALLRNVRVSQSNMWGSGGERMVYRRRAFSMDASMKSGALFVTMTPTDVGTINVSVIAGEMDKREMEDMKASGRMPTCAQRIEVSGMDPVA